MYCIKTLLGKQKEEKEQESKCHELAAPIEQPGRPEPGSHTDLQVYQAKRGEGKKDEEEKSISKLSPAPSQIFPNLYSLLTSLPKRDDLIQSTQTSSRFLQLKHMFT